MMNSKKIKSLVLSSVLFIIPTLLVADSLDPLSSIQGGKMMEQSILGHSTKNKNCSKKHQPLEPTDFKGVWIGYGHSVGGVVSPAAEGQSSHALFSVTFNSDGNGTINPEGTLLQYSGTPGEVEVSSFRGKIELAITNPKYSCGMMTITRPDSSAPNEISIATFSFIAQRCLCTGKVVKISTHRLTDNSQQNSVVYQEFVPMYVECE